LPLHLIPDPIPFAYTVKTAFAVLLIVLCLYTCRKRGTAAAVLLCFVLPLLPVLAFFQNGEQAFAARFTYLPSVAPCVAVAYLFLRFYRETATCNRLPRYMAQGVIAILLLFYIGMTLRLIPVWNNSESFWNRVVEIEPSAIAFKDRAILFMQMKKYDAAVEDFTAAIRKPLDVWSPYIYNLYAFRGEALSLAGRYDEAVNDFTTAIKMLPHPTYYRLRGIALSKSGNLMEANKDFKMAGDEIVSIDWYWIKAESSK
jgi:tetratricopeptide (TPR) repeat protein